MAGLTLAQAEARLTAWLEADAAVSSNQSYSINGRTLTRANAKEIRDNIEFWDSKVKELDVQTRGRRGPRYPVGV